MCRFSILIVRIAIPAVMALTAPASHAQGTGKTVWVGQHIHGIDKNDYSDFVRANVELRLVEIKGRGQTTPALETYLADHDVRTNDQIATSANDRETHYLSNAATTLFVTSGIGVGDAADMESGVYLGPQVDAFAVEQARTKLLAVSGQPVADMYLRLLLHYALIKNAVQLSMDYETVISPLRETALDLVHQAGPAQPMTVKAIRDELIALAGG
ncbi:hypothetical protein [Microbaculum marinum]|uniref:Uncharacterized protein n=1 Tax=Microbaculum marinum TaxID=1764581 RepID=A0AAW9RKA8_9HYPH